MFRKSTLFQDASDGVIWKINDCDVYKRKYTMLDCAKLTEHQVTEEMIHNHMKYIGVLGYNKGFRPILGETRLIGWRDSNNKVGQGSGRLLTVVAYHPERDRYMIRYLDNGKEGSWVSSTLMSRTQPVYEFRKENLRILPVNNVEPVEIKNEYLYLSPRHARKTINFGSLYGTGGKFNPFTMSNFNKQEKEPMKNFEQKLVTHIRGTNADDMSDDAILKVIQGIESEIRTRREMKTHSKTQVVKINELEADIEALVKFLDGRNELLDKD